MSQNAGGFPEISAEIQTTAQAWKLIEQDYTLRLSLAAGEWAEEHLKAWNAVFAEGRKRGNSAYCGPALVEMEIADEDKRAEWSYRTCCEIWEVQGRPKCRPFFRAIFESCLQPMFAVREGCFTHQLELQHRRTGARTLQDLSVIGGHMKRERDKLQAKWNTKLEIATRDNEYQQKLLRPERLQQGSTLTALLPTNAASDLQRLPVNVTAEVTPHSSSALMSTVQIRSIASSFNWKELENRFREIQAKPSVRERFRAEFTRTEWDSGSVTEEWMMRGNAACRTEFERLASIAARKLGYKGSEDALKYWLERLREWLCKTGLDKDSDMAWCPKGSGHIKGSFYTTSHLYTEQIAELSAMFCMELMAHGALECAVLPPLEQQEGGGSKSRLGRATKKTARSKTQLRKTGVIFGAIQSGLKALKYCAALDARRVQLPNHWIEEECPSTYLQAYREVKWRKRIQDEKSRYREEYEMTPVHEREALIQGESSTRRTRR